MLREGKVEGLVPLNNSENNFEDNLQQYMGYVM
jgi:hypothetical protein